MIASSVNLDITVAIAAPRTPILGSPKRPKIKSALNTKFISMAIMLATIGSVVLPDSLMALA